LFQLCSDNLPVVRDLLILQDKHNIGTLPLNITMNWEYSSFYYYWRYMWIL